jgi:hypothetical protein
MAERLRPAITTFPPPRGSLCSVVVAGRPCLIFDVASQNAHQQIPSKAALHQQQVAAPPPAALSAGLSRGMETRGGGDVPTTLYRRHSIPLLWGGCSRGVACPTRSSLTLSDILTTWGEKETPNYK